MLLRLRPCHRPRLPGMRGGYHLSSGGIVPRTPMAMASLITAVGALGASTLDESSAAPKEGGTEATATSSLWDCSWRRGLRSWYSLIGRRLDCDRKVTRIYSLGCFELSCTHGGTIPASAFRLDCTLEGSARATSQGLDLVPARLLWGLSVRTLVSGACACDSGYGPSTSSSSSSSS